MNKKDLMGEMSFLWVNVSLGGDTQTEKAFTSWLEKQEQCPETAEEALKSFFAAQGQEALATLPSQQESRTYDTSEIRERRKKNPPRFPGKEHTNSE